MRKQIIPWLITSLRVAILPLLIISFNQQIQSATHALFLFAISTDFFDGYAAKKLEATSRRGAYIDVTADFLFITGMFLTFILRGIYPPWLLLFIIAAFAQFILTSYHLKRALYDPIGKYYGSLMYAGIGLTLLFSEQIVFSIVIIGIAASTFAAFLGRLLFLLHMQNRK